MISELRLGFIGAGCRGKRLAQCCHDLKSGIRVVAGTDTDPEVLRSFEQKFGNNVFATDDYRRLLDRKNIDAVFVASPDFLHKEHTVAALKAGKHVYLEKPMAITIKDCDEILQTAYQTKMKVFVGHNMRHMSFVLKMKEIIDSGRIGEVKTAWCRHFISYGGDAYFKDWHVERSKGTGLLLQKAAHDIDVLHWLCGGYTKKVNAFGGLTVYGQIKDRHGIDQKGDATCHVENWPPLAQTKLNPIIDVEDVSMMQMLFDNGVFAAYQQCHFTPDGWRNYTVIGTEGRVENFGDEPGKCVIRVWNRRTDYNPYGDEQYYMPPVKGSHGGADLEIIKSFVESITHGAKTKISAIAARNSVAAGCCATESLRNNGIPLDIPPLDDELIKYFNKDVV